MSWIIIIENGVRRVVDTRAVTPATVKAMATRQKKRGLVIAGYLHKSGPVALATKVC